jgi:predicted outer membrane repeat protein
LEIVKCSFVNCSTAGAGGGLGIALEEATTADQHQSIHISETSFSYCSSTSLVFGGGALMIGSPPVGPKSMAMSGMQLLFDNLHIHHCSSLSGAGGGGGILVLFGNPISNATVCFVQCIFMNNTAASMLGGAGGGLMIWHYYASSYSNVNITACQFNSNIATGWDGGGLYILYYSGVRTFGSTCVVRACTFSYNTAPETHGGGGLAIRHDGAAFLTAVYIQSCVFRNNVAGKGAGLVALHYADSSHTLLSIEDCVFLGNIAAHGGGAIKANFVATNAAEVKISASSFTSNSVAGQEGKGGAVCLESISGTLTVFVINSSFTANKASKFGGALYAGQKGVNAPINLEMTVDVLETTNPKCGYPGDPTCLVCYSKFNNTFREWEYQFVLHVETCWFVRNTAAGTHSYLSAASSSSGGALALANVNATLQSCTVVKNMAKTSGGAIYMLPGSARVRLIGQTNVNKNRAEEDLGSLLHSESGGSLEFDGNSVVKFDTEKNKGPSVMVSQGGHIRFGPKSTLQCNQGEFFSQNLRQFAVGLGSQWQINCSAFLAFPNGSEPNCGTTFDLSFANPSCHQLCVNIENRRTCILSLGTGSNPACANNLPLQPAMNISSGTLRCTPCPAGLYSLDTGMLVGGVLSNIECIACPYGGTCEGGNQLKARQNFWGFINTKNTAQTVEFGQCPRDYCCSSPDGCPWRLSSACQGNRDPRVPFCGSCLRGFSHAVDSDHCIVDAECGVRRPWNVALYCIGQVMYWIGFNCYFLYQAQFLPLLHFVDNALKYAKGCVHVVSRGRFTSMEWKRGSCNDGALSLLIYFYQLAMLMAPQDYGKHTISAVASFCGIQHLPSTGFGTCVKVGMDDIDKLMLGLLYPFFMFVLLMVMRPLLQRFTASRDPLPTERPLLSRCSESELQVEERIVVHDQGQSNRVPFYSAVACLLLYCYTAFAQHTIRLLNCVDAGDADLVLKYAGSYGCDLMGWRKLVITLTAFLISLPALPILCWLLLSQRWIAVRLIHTHLWVLLQSSTLLRAVLSHAVQPFDAKYWHWAAMLVLQRLMTVMCNALSTTSVAASVGEALVSLMFLMLHMLVRPYRLAWVNNLQTCACVCLVTFAILSSVKGAFLSAGFDPNVQGDRPIIHLQTISDLMMSIALLLPPIMFVYYRMVELYPGRAKTASNNATEDHQFRTSELQRLLDQKEAEVIELQRRLSTSHQENKESAQDDELCDDLLDVPGCSAFETAEEPLP